MLSSLFYSFITTLVEDGYPYLESGICLFLVVSLCLLGGLFAALRSRTDRKKLWLTVWIVWTTLLVGLDVYFSYTCICLAFDYEYATSLNYTGVVISSVLVLLVYFGGSVLGHFFKVRKALCWLAILPVSVLFLFCIYAGFWFSLASEYAKITDRELSAQELADGQGVDYEIEASDVDARGDYRRVLNIRGIGDSVYVRTVCSNCTKVSYEKDSVTEASVVGIGPAAGDASRWTLLTPAESGSAKKLMNAIEEYEQEYVIGSFGVDGYTSSFSLKDFKRGTYRRVYIGSSHDSDAYYASKIQKLVDELMSSRKELL